MYNIYDVEYTGSYKAPDYTYYCHCNDFNFNIVLKIMNFTYSLLQ
jgi:hypothetical protein